MNKDYSRKKKITIAALTLVAVCLAGGLCYYMSVLNRSEPPATEPEREPASKVEILVPEISTDNTPSASSEEEAENETEIPQPSTGSTETMGGDVQAKPSADQPKSPSEATPPTHAPTESDIAPVENPDGGGECQPEQTPQPEPSQPQSGDKQNGQIYVPGFGWIEDNGGGSNVQEAPNAGTGDPIGDM